MQVIIDALFAFCAALGALVLVAVFGFLIGWKVIHLVAGAQIKRKERQAALTSNGTLNSPTN